MSMLDQHDDELIVDPPIDYLCVDVAPRDGATLITLRGELDAASAGLVRSAMASVAQNGNAEIDAAQLSFVDSSGLRALIESTKRLGAYGHTLSIRNPQPQVYRVFEIMGLVERLQVTPSQVAPE